MSDPKKLIDVTDLSNLRSMTLIDRMTGARTKVLGSISEISQRSASPYQEPTLRDFIGRGEVSFRATFKTQTAFVVTNREPDDGAVQYASKSIAETMLASMRQQEDELLFGQPVAPVEPTQNILQAILTAAKAVESIWKPDSIRAYVMHPIFWEKLVKGQPAPSSPPTGHLGGVRQVIQGMPIYTDLAMPHTKAYGVKHKCFEAFQKYLREGMPPMAALMMASIEGRPQETSEKPQGKKKRSRHQANPPRQSTFQVGKKPRKEWE